MNTIYYPGESAVKTALKSGEPILVLISFDGGQVVMSPADEALEHHILLEKVGIDSRCVDRYFRIVLDDEGADWTFVCPPDYKDIEDKQRRITSFYKDGLAAISEVLLSLGLVVGINIPKRYCRRFDFVVSE